MSRRFWIELRGALATCGAVTRSTLLYSTYIKAPRSAFGGKGGENPGDRPLTRRPDDQGARPHRHCRSPLRSEAHTGNVADVAVAPVLLARAPGAQYVLADKGYDADTLRRGVRQSGAVPVIPGRSTRKRRIVYDKSRYRERHLIENAFCRLKDFRSVATRYDKLARTSSPPLLWLQS